MTCPSQSRRAPKITDIYKNGPYKKYWPDVYKQYWHLKICTFIYANDIDLYKIHILILIKRMYWCLQNTLISTKDGPPNWAGQTDRRWPTPRRWSLMQPGAAFVIHIQSLNSAPFHNGQWAVHLLTFSTGQCTYLKWALSSAPICIGHWALYLSSFGTGQCTYSQWALSSTSTHNGQTVHLHCGQRWHNAHHQSDAQHCRVRRVNSHNSPLQSEGEGG